MLQTTYEDVSTRYLAFGLGLLLVVLTPIDLSACSGCATETKSHLSPEMEEKIAAQRSEAEKQGVRNYGCMDWWQEKFPDLDATTHGMLMRFHDLMVARGSLVSARRENVALIRQARATSGFGADHRSPTAQAYRQAVFAVENALDAHPALQVYEAQLEELQAERRAITAGQAEVLDTWQAATRERDALYSEAVRLAMQDYAEAVAALRERAGVEPREALPEAFEAELQAITDKRQAALDFARDTQRRVKDPENIAQSRAEDGSQALFDAANEKYKEIDAAQERIRAEKAAARQRLRTSDPAVLRLVASMQEASQAHITAMGAREDVKDARASVADVDEKRADIEREARLLRRDIVAQHPDTYPMLDEIAALGGLGNMPATYWNFQD